MKRGWVNKPFQYLKLRERISPADNVRYYISVEVLEFTESILKEYGSIEPSHEGIVLWAGRKNDNKIIINSAIAPDTDSSGTHIIIKPESMVKFITFLSDNKLTYVGQIHSHPGSWVGHSTGDNDLTCFKREGLISIVAPNYGLNGILPLSKCGVHRFMNGNFTLLTTTYVIKRIKLLRIDAKLNDLRNKMDTRWTVRNGID
jgi:hypothetical protein